MQRCRSARAVLLALVTTTVVPLRVRGAVMPLEAVRPYDPVVVQTGRLPRLPDRDPAHYRLYVMRGTRLVPIPFQVDARDGQGRYVFDQMLGGVGAPFDDDDELVFMAKETGPRIAPACLPDDPSATEIEVRDPVDRRARRRLPGARSRRPAAGRAGVRGVRSSAGRGAGAILSPAVPSGA